MFLENQKLFCFGTNSAFECIPFTSREKKKIWWSCKQSFTFCPILLGWPEWEGVGKKSGLKARGMASGLAVPTVSFSPSWVTSQPGVRARSEAAAGLWPPLWNRAAGACGSEREVFVSHSADASAIYSPGWSDRKIKHSKCFLLCPKAWWPVSGGEFSAHQGSNPRLLFPPLLPGRAVSGGETSGSLGSTKKISQGRAGWVICQEFVSTLGHPPPPPTPRKKKQPDSRCW